jgi:hypothetical protein
MNSKMNLGQAIEIMVNARREYDATRPKIVVLDEVPKPQKVEAPQKKICEAITMGGKPCKMAINPVYKCFCTRHGKKT